MKQPANLLCIIGASSMAGVFLSEGSIAFGGAVLIVIGLLYEMHGPSKS